MKPEAPYIEEAKRQFKEQYPTYKIVASHYDWLDSKVWVTGEKRIGKVYETRKITYHVQLQDRSH